jgi:uncharacterized protein YoxC
MVAWIRTHALISVGIAFVLGSVLGGAALDDADTVTRLRQQVDSLEDINRSLLNRNETLEDDISDATAELSKQSRAWTTR